ncbi:hypothetical protein GXN76_02025 [Kroppenstedtia pulmonis]|uniref:Stage III sporulation protein AC n=1 Tax=Kroppenstedtia pulmonis TaxID=1380685 RepID=A0A7D3Y353_9BACL|nr:hypothetical protein [Kroppenstedtia pulmonis]QKG83365.1 hypothetical protein GXN76_02025 [Kroppenstedtia pulmonis]
MESIINIVAFVIIIMGVVGLVKNLSAERAGWGIACIVGAIVAVVIVKDVGGAQKVVSDVMAQILKAFARDATK